MRIKEILKKCFIKKKTITISKKTGQNIALILLLLGCSFLSLGMKLQHDKNVNERVLFYSKQTANKNYKNAKINLNQIKESTNNEVKVEEKKEEQVVQIAAVQSQKLWYYPVNHGQISRGMGYNSYDGFHYGYDLTSPYGSYETIYPIADGIVSGVFYDNAGAKIVTVRHLINGTNYTSLYAHLSSFAPGIEAGKIVNTNTPIGQMGTTGRSTGVHLHIEVADCALFDPNDANCSNLGSYYNYLAVRYNQGFSGAGTILGLPYSWNGR